MVLSTSTLTDPNRPSLPRLSNFTSRAPVGRVSSSSFSHHCKIAESLSHWRFDGEQVCLGIGTPSFGLLRVFHGHFSYWSAIVSEADDAVTPPKW